MICLLVLCLQIASMHAAPFQMQLQPHQIPMYQLQPQMMQASQQASLQQQLMALQQLQALQRLNTVHSPLTITIPQPLQLILLPQPMKDINEIEENLNHAEENDSQENNAPHTKQETGYEDKDLESIVIDTKTNMQDLEPPRAILLGPNGRWIIGDFISSIPWLPFEVNVPDTISWAYNGISSGISGIISIIGQRLPFRPQTKDSTGQYQDVNVNMFLKQLMKKQTVPIMIIPVNGMMLPMRM